MQDRILSTRQGAITSVQAVYVPADDMTDPAVSTILNHLDTTVILSRSQAGEGIYPAVDPLQSGTRLMDRHTLGERHYRVAEQVREHLARYRELVDIITMLGIEELSPRDRGIVMRARKLQRYLTQPFWTTASHTGIQGVSVSLDDTLADCEDFLAGRYDEIPEDRCYMRGTMK
jgi:F-type H+-transporting ATPase subunit beta